MPTSNNYSGFVDGPTIRIYFSPHHGSSWPDALDICFFLGAANSTSDMLDCMQGGSPRTIDDAHVNNVARVLRTRDPSSVGTKRDMSCYYVHWKLGLISQWSEG